MLADTLCLLLYDIQIVKSYTRKEIIIHLRDKMMPEKLKVQNCNLLQCSVFLFRNLFSLVTCI